MKVSLILFLIVATTFCGCGKKEHGVSNPDTGERAVAIEIKEVKILSHDTYLWTILDADYIEGIVNLLPSLQGQQLRSDTHLVSPPSDIKYELRVNYIDVEGNADLLILYFTDKHRLINYKIPDNLRSQIETWAKDKLP